MAIRPLVHKVRILTGARGAKDLFWVYSGGGALEAYFGPIQGARGLFWAITGSHTFKNLSLWPFWSPCKCSYVPTFSVWSICWHVCLVYS